MFVEEPLLPPMPEGLPASVKKEFKTLAKERDEHLLGGEAHAVGYYALQARPMDGKLPSDAATSHGVYVNLQLGGKSLCDKFNGFTNGSWNEGMRQLYNDKVAELPAIEQAVIDGLLAMGFGPDPTVRGGYPANAVVTHESVRSQKERIDEISNLIESGRLIVQRNEDTIKRIDEKLAKHKEKLLAL